MSIFISPLGIDQSLVKQVDYRALGILQLWGKGAGDLVTPSDQCNLDTKGHLPHHPTKVWTYVPSAS